MVSCKQRCCKWIKAQRISCFRQQVTDGSEIVLNLSSSRRERECLPRYFVLGNALLCFIPYRDFNLIHIVADRASYAAFCHDETFEGIVQGWHPTRSMRLSSVRTYLEKEPQTPSLLPGRRVQLFPETQLWLHGTKMTLHRAQKYVDVGTKLFIAVRRRQYKDINVLPAYAIFDWQSWRAYAQSELNTAKDIFEPRSPQYRRTRD